MKVNTQKITIRSLNLLALGLTAGDPSLLLPQYSKSLEANHQAIEQGMDMNQMRTIEASHLEVYAGCKWGHAAFDPVQVKDEILSPDVQALYLQMS